MKELSLYETRIIGALIEKSITTPDQYPLSLNALTSACNQKSNRDPVLELAESTVLDTASQLVEQGLVTEVSGFGSRVSKYKHRFCNTEFSDLKLSAQELGIICVLFLRGPQTPGELRSRTNRLCEFKDVQELELVLYRMMKREGGPLIEKLEREPGRRESRYRHLFSGDEPQQQAAPLSTRTSPATSATASQDSNEELLQRIEALEARVKDLEELVDGLTS